MDKLYSQFQNPPKVTPEVMSDENMTESAGYMTAQQRIEQMINAGRRLAEYREEQFDLDGDDDDDDAVIDPTRHPGFDMAEASQILNEVSPRLKPGKPEKKPEKAAQEAPGQQQETLPGVEVPPEKK